MDPRRFDRVVRSLAEGYPRRTLLKGLLAAVAAGGVTTRRAAAQAIPNGQACTQDSQCESGICADGFCCNDICIDNCEACNIPGSEGTCMPRPLGSEGDCPPPFVCRGEISGGFEACCAPNGVVAPAENCCSGFAPQNVCCDTACDGPCETCTADGSFGTCTTIPGCGQCEIDADCDAGEICCAGDCLTQECCGVGDADHCPEGTLCNKNVVCEDVTNQCEVDEDCLQAVLAQGLAPICCGGACVAGIECCIEDENPNDRCAEGEICFEGQCVFVCKGDADCEAGTCCCPDGSCAASCCAGETPTDTDDGPDDVSTLPSTGVADGDTGNALLGAALAAGAAALLAGQRLRGPAGESAEE